MLIFSIASGYSPIVVVQETAIGDGTCVPRCWCRLCLIVLILENLIEKESGLEIALKILGAAAWEVLLPASYFLKTQAQAGRGCAVSPVQCEDFSLMQSKHLFHSVEIGCTELACPAKSLLY